MYINNLSKKEHFSNYIYSDFMEFETFVRNVYKNTFMTLCIPKHVQL